MRDILSGATFVCVFAATVCLMAMAMFSYAILDVSVNVLDLLRAQEATQCIDPGLD